MIAPTLPDGLVEDLRTIRRTFELRWNPKGKVIVAGRVDAVGRTTQPVYEPRWEMWDTDPDGVEYRFMTVQDDEGGFRHPGYWLVTHLRKWNPERFNGDMNRMVLEFMDDPNEKLEISRMKDSDDFIDRVSLWASYVVKPKERTLKSMGELEAIHKSWETQRAMGSAATAPTGSNKLIEVASH